MICYVVIPVFNEESTLALTMESLVNQIIQPTKIVLVNDGSTDNTANLIDQYSAEHSFIEAIHLETESKHIPGSKVVDAFNKGLAILDNNYDVICKMDADIVLPTNYFEEILALFKSNQKIGVAGGLLFIKKQNQWIYENIASKEHVRGPIKAYRKSCFNDIGGLKSVIGWDTIDTLLAQYYNWQICTIKDLHVKHLKPTGASYSKASKLLMGERWYNMRYGLLLTIIASLKDSFNRKKISIFFYTLKGYFLSKYNNIQPAVTKKEGLFIRKLRWQGIRKKFF